MQPSGSQSGTVCTLKKIVPVDWPAERLEWLWKKCQGEDYAVDDYAKDNPRAFLAQMFSQDSEAYEIGDDGIVLVTNILPGCNAVVHFALWGELRMQVLFDLTHALFTHLFNDHKLHRLTAFIPAFNKQAIRLATLCGFRYEGEMRETFLKHGVYHNVQFYGLLSKTFFKRERGS